VLAQGSSGIILGSFLITILFLVLGIFMGYFILYVLFIIFLTFSLFNLFFFRDPNRIIPENPLAVLSPADGKVLQIIEEFENNFFDAKSIRISIFLSVFNVHVNRNPVSGIVNYFAYNRGNFFAAFKEKASMENEQTHIGITTKSGYKIMFKQIAGIIARRIVCNLKEGNEIEMGDRMGLIRYGSRVDVFLPSSAKVIVSVDQLVKGGESIIAMLPENNSVALKQKISEVPELEPI
jgi:phosphatidylserine decarboxylase